MDSGGKLAGKVVTVGEAKASVTPGAEVTVALEGPCPGCGGRAGVRGTAQGDEALSGLTPTDIFHDDPMCEWYRTTPANGVMERLVYAGKLVPVVGNR